MSRSSVSIFFQDGVGPECEPPRPCLEALSRCRPGRLSPRRPFPRAPSRLGCAPCLRRLETGPRCGAADRSMVRMASIRATSTQFNSRVNALTRSGTAALAAGPSCASASAAANACLHRVPAQVANQGVDASGGLGGRVCSEPMASPGRQRTLGGPSGSTHTNQPQPQSGHEVFVHGAQLRVASAPHACPCENGSPASSGTKRKAGVFSWFVRPGPAPVPLLAGRNESRDGFK